MSGGTEMSWQLSGVGAGLLKPGAGCGGRLEGVNGRGKGAYVIFSTTFSIRILKIIITKKLCNHMGNSLCYRKCVKDSYKNF